MPKIARLEKRKVGAYYLKGERAIPLSEMQRMLHLYSIQQRYYLTDRVARETIYNSQVMHVLADINPSLGAAPDLVALVRFRRFLSIQSARMRTKYHSVRVQGSPAIVN